MTTTTTRTSISNGGGGSDGNPFSSSSSVVVTATVVVVVVISTTITSFVTGFVVSKCISSSSTQNSQKKNNNNHDDCNEHVNDDGEGDGGRSSSISTATMAAHEQLIERGTPLVKLHRVSKLIGRQIYVKMESCNPGGTGKDRAALSMIRHAEFHGLLPHPVNININVGAARRKEDQQNDDDDNVDRITVSNIRDGKYNDLELSAEHLHQQQTTTTADNDLQKQLSPSETKLNEMILQAIGGKKNNNNNDTNNTTSSPSSSSSSSNNWSGGLVVEGTSGSTGIALATLCASRGHACLVVMPDDQATEKQIILRSLGAVVYVVPTASISNPNHYVNLARSAARIARDIHHIQAVFVNQFENEANYEIHYTRTGPEIYNQLQERRQQRRQRHRKHWWQQWWPLSSSSSSSSSSSLVDAFVMSSGTGGTISGVGTYLKEQDSKTRIVLVDPPGSSLHNKIQYGVAYTSQQQERTMKKHRYDTLAEGIGLDRVTHNFALGLDCIDTSIQVTDQEAVDMSHLILQMEGLWIGSSSSMNLVGAIRTALSLPHHSTIVTIICDGGQRHVTRFWNPTFVKEWGLVWPPDSNYGRDGGVVPDCIRDVVATTGNGS